MMIMPLIIKGSRPQNWAGNEFEMLAMVERFHNKHGLELRRQRIWETATNY
jgi:hypothetical protein